MEKEETYTQIIEYEAGLLYHMNVMKYILYIFTHK